MFIFKPTKIAQFAKIGEMGWELNCFTITFNKPMSRKSCRIGEVGSKVLWKL